jgi:uncharacterized integral membrane protein
MSKQQKYFEDQFDDEEVLFVFRKHPIVMRKGLIVSSLALLMGTIPALIKPEYIWFFGGLLGGVLLSVAVFMPFWISWYFSVYIMTSQRLLQITRKGLFSHSTVGLSLDQIQMVNYQVEGIEQSLLGFGTIMVQTYVGSLTIGHVHHPARVQKRIIRILRNQNIPAFVGVSGQNSIQEKSDSEE